MGRLGTYKVELKGLKESSATYEWVVGNDFFALVEGEDVQKGNVNAKFHLNKESLCRLRETSVPFSKKELQEMLKR